MTDNGREEKIKGNGGGVVVISGTRGVQLIHKSGFKSKLVLHTTTFPWVKM